MHCFWISSLNNYIIKMDSNKKVTIYFNSNINLMQNSNFCNKYRVFMVHAIFISTHHWIHKQFDGLKTVVKWKLSEENYPVIEVGRMRKIHIKSTVASGSQQSSCTAGMYASLT